jgi:hypothetical protein
MSFKAGFTEGSGSAARYAGRARVPWRTCAAAAALLGVPVMAAAAATFTILPVWWATTVGNQVGGDPAGGIVMGMAIGFIFTLAPLLAAWPACHPQVGRPWKAAVLAAALLLAAPNLLTAGICFGTSSGTGQARRILGIEATWFAQWTLYSAVAGALVFAAVVLLWAAWRRGGSGR